MVIPREALSSRGKHCHPERSTVIPSEALSSRAKHCHPERSIVIPSEALSSRAKRGISVFFVIPSPPSLTLRYAPRRIPAEYDISLNRSLVYPRNPRNPQLKMQLTPALWLRISRISRTNQKCSMCRDPTRGPRSLAALGMTKRTRMRIRSYFPQLSGLAPLL
jgi:hypothetical protein